MATKGITPAQDIKQKLEVVDAGNGLGGVFAKPDGQKFKQRAKKAVTAKQKKVAEYRKEASRLASMANKRVARLEANNLKDAPAYKGYIESGGKFSVKGKSYNELQKEVARMKTFIDANTSTVKGVNNYLKTIASNTGIKYKNLTDLRLKAPRFFELAAKVEQYLRNVEDIASAIGYQKIWEAINVYVKDSKADLSAAEVDIDEMVKRVTDAIMETQSPDNVSLEALKAYEASTWFKLE